MSMRAMGTGLAAVALACLWAFGTPAAAEEPVDFDDQYLVMSGVNLYGSEREEIRAAQDDLFEATGINLYVALVSTFDGASSAANWADRTASLNELGEKDVVLAIAVDDRNYGYSIDSVGALSTSQVESVVTSNLLPQLRENQWSDAVVQFAGGLRNELAPQPPYLLIGAGVVGLGAIAWPVTVSITRRRAASRKRREDAALVEERVVASARALVATDDSIKTAAQELGFLEAEFGADTIIPFEEALTVAKGFLEDAFELRRELDDEVPDSETKRRTFAEKILDLCAQAEATLDVQENSFESLRDLQSHAPALREQLLVERGTSAEQIVRIEKILNDLTATYGEAALSSAAGTLAQARDLDALTLISLTNTETAIRGGELGRAAVHVRAAQQAQDQIATLVASVDNLAITIPALIERLSIAQADAEADVGAARAIAAPESTDAELLSAITGLDQALAESRKVGPEISLPLLGQADLALATVVEKLTERRLKRERAVSLLPGMLETAHASIERAQTFINTRRGAIDDYPRRQLQEANRKLALVGGLGDDPSAAFDTANEANTLARRALAWAQKGVSESRWESGDATSGGFLGGIFGSSYSDDSASGTSRSGWGSSSSSSWGSSSSSSYSSGGSSSSSSRSSGGSSSSSSRSSGGGRF